MQKVVASGCSHAFYKSLPPFSVNYDPAEVAQPLWIIGQHRKKKRKKKENLISVMK